MQDIRAERGVPSLVWRAGQDRRLAMIRKWGRTHNASILVDGCGMGQYVVHLLEDSPRVVAFDIEYQRAAKAHQQASMVHVAAAEALSYSANAFDLILSHEVLEHVRDDQAALAEMVRVLKPGGRAVIFCPNRWYPFETHGHYWRGKYHFGNTPLINYLPDRWRNKLAPHVRVYTWHGLRHMIEELPVRIVHHTRIYGAYDNIIARFGALGRILRAVLYLFERTPLRVFGLSHLVVIEKMG
ncbi:MAG: class I SAM-dependent methyltransferase [Anaerolineae bacterium]|nr:class I SAM-dependent methyltransferase [Anaerolineae bacterium]